MSERIPLTGPDRADAERNLKVYEGVARDLRDLLTNGAPSVEELDEMGAPLLDAWSLASRPVACLVGAVVGHPILGGPIITTSPLLGLVRSARAARTQSRWYRLGDPLDAFGEGETH